jgi:hypothetical protein
VKQRLNVPENVRQTLSGFAFYDGAQGLASMLGRMDFSGVTRRQIAFAVLGRAPEKASEKARDAADEPAAEFDGRGQFRTALNSGEFQRRIRELALHAFPEKRRMIFVHVPKCAGSDLQLALQRNHPYLHHHLALPHITAKPALFEALHDMAVGTAFSDTIAVSGHVPLRWYTERKLVRFEDRLFTTVRHPRDIMYSYVSFILTRLIQNQGTKRADTSEWLGHIGLEAIEPDPSPGYLLEIGSALLRAPEVTTPNMICHFLGSGTAASATDAIAATDIELTDMRRYSAWRRANFDFEPATRVNPSEALFTEDTATPADRALIEEMTSQDMPLYERIVAALDADGGLSIRGRALA